MYGHLLNNINSLSLFSTFSLYLFLIHSLSLSLWLNYLEYTTSPSAVETHSSNYPSWTGKSYKFWSSLFKFKICLSSYKMGVAYWRHNVLLEKKQDKFTTCFKNLWNNPVRVSGNQKKHIGTKFSNWTPKMESLTQKHMEKSPNSIKIEPNLTKLLFQNLCSTGKSIC